MTNKSLVNTLVKYFGISRKEAENEIRKIPPRLRECDYEIPRKVVLLGYDNPRLLFSPEF